MLNFELINEVKAGSEEAFSELYRITYPQVLSRASFQDSEIENREEYVNDAFMLAYTALTSGKAAVTDPSKFLPWMDTIVLKCRSDYYRREKAQKRVAYMDGERVPDASLTCEMIEIFGGAEMSTEDRFVSEAERSEVRAILRQTLTGQSLKVYELHYLAGLDTEEIAAEMGLSRKTVQNTLHRCRARLRAAFEQAGITALSISSPAFFYLSPNGTRRAA